MRHYFLCNPLIIFLFLLIFSPAIFSMEQEVVSEKKKNKMVELQLFDNDNPYSIARWKVTKESNMLCENYYSHKKNKHIIVDNISTQEIKLFDKALDALIDKVKIENSFSKYFENLSLDEQRILTIAAGQYGVDGKKRKLHAQRLTAQLVDELIDFAVIKKNIFGLQCSDLQSLVFALKDFIIVDNIQNKNVVQSVPLSYQPGPDNFKLLFGGAIKYIPKVAEFSCSSFNGETDKFGVEHEGSKYMGYAGIGEHLMTSSKIENGAIFSPEINIWNMNPKRLIKSIQHHSGISEAIFSRDGKWVVSSSAGRPDSFLMLTCLDNSGFSQDAYLSDISLNQRLNFTSSLCFNNSSTLLANGRLGHIELLDLVTKNCIKQLKISFIRPLNMMFNHDDSRLIVFMEHGVGRDEHTVVVWDTSDLNNIRELNKVKISTKRSMCGNIVFNPTDRNIVAISTEYVTLFFDIHSGAFLSKMSKFLENININEEIPSVNAGTTFMPYSPIALVGMNKSDGSSCVKACNYMSGDCIGIIPFQQPSMNGIGLASRDKCLVSTFDRYNFIQTQLMNDKQVQALKKDMKMMNAVDFYGLLQLHRARQQKCSANLSQPLLAYIQKRFFSDDKDQEQELIKKYFF